MELFDASEARKNVENVLDQDTMEALYDLAGDGHFDVIGGFVKDGKESKVAVADKGEELRAVKLYVVEASNYRDMEQYLVGDPRFEGIATDRRSVIFNWAKKEFRNLEKARHLGIPAPEPVAVEKNVLVMEFIGQEYRPAPKLQEVDLENPEVALDRLPSYMQTLWQDAEMVHGDLSAFNVLLWEEQLRPIDFSQAVLKAHPRADELLRRDVENIADHFRRQYSMAVEEAEILDTITGGEAL
ncbi:MAG: serine protein kinase RIO [Candidatus Nanohaloarchaea archaeon]|nr:serine protein kinase RIO [Candidatus Nanohaloarchaea archaeon]